MATPDLKAAVLGGQQAGAGASPLGNFPEIAKMYAINAPLALSNSKQQAGGYSDAVTLANQKTARDAEQQRLQALADPSKYQQVPAKDGGYNFTDPTGKPISAYDYSRITGQDLGKILNQSQNPIDIGFNQDWQNLQNYLNAKVGSHNDSKVLATAQSIEKTVSQETGGKVDLAKMNIQDVIKRFQAAYPTVFGYHQAGVPAGQTFLPSAGAGYGLGSGGTIGTPAGP